MTKTISNMTKEELIHKIVEFDEMGKRLERSAQNLIEIRGKHLSQIKEIDKEVDRCLDAMKKAAIARTEMKRLLIDKYDCFIM